MNPDRFLETGAPDWIGLPMRRNRFGYEWKLPHGEIGGIISRSPVNYRRGLEWLPIEDTMVLDQSSVLRFEHDQRVGVAPGGFIVENGTAYGVRSLGVERDGRYRAVWKAGTYGAEEDWIVRQALGPYDLTTDFRSGRKQQIILPAMPDVDGDALVLDYWARGLPPPDRCRCAPKVIDANGIVIPMRKWRTAEGKAESIPLEVLARLAFPVILDPEVILAPGGVRITGNSGTYAIARSTATAFLGGGCAYSGQNRIGTPAFRISRDATRWDASAYSGTIGAAWLRVSCCTGVSAPVDQTDTMVFSRCDWSAWDPAGAAEMENVYDCILNSVHGADLWTVGELEALGCGTCTFCTWKPLNVGDVAHLNAVLGLGSILYCGVHSKQIGRAHV